METKKSDLLEKGAIVQNDYQTYAIAPHLPGGICTPATLRKIADIAEKYEAKALKCTSAQRIAIVYTPPLCQDQKSRKLRFENAGCQEQVKSP